MDPTNIDHDTFEPLQEMDPDSTFVEVIEKLNEIVNTVNAIVVTVNGTHGLEQNPEP